MSGYESSRNSPFIVFLSDSDEEKSERSPSIVSDSDEVIIEEGSIISVWNSPSIISVYDRNQTGEESTNDVWRSPCFSVSSLYEMEEDTLNEIIVRIQAWFRGHMFRLKRLPLIMYKLQKFMKSQNIQCSNVNEDGRVNSCIDEDVVVKMLQDKFGDRIKKPNIRMWYDMLVFDDIYGWIPVNIKTTTTLTNDNTGNLAMCVHSYTDKKLDLHSNTTYDNGKMSKILLNSLKNKEYNRNHKKDYYFLVINKKNPTDVIINSIKGLNTLTPNINNLPFQVCWNKNRNFEFKNINEIVYLFIECLQKPKPSWKEVFMSEIRMLYYK